MCNNASFVLVDEVRLIGNEVFPNPVKGIFVGTVNYLFFIPVAALVRPEKGEDLETYNYQGASVAAIIRKRFLHNNSDEKQIENFILTQIKKAIPETICINFNDIAKFKVFGNLFVSGIMVNKTEGNTGWEMFVSKLRKSKKIIKSFYNNHPKLV